MKEDMLKLACEIFALALLVNEETDYCVFVDFSGHVDSIEVRFAESKQNYNKKIFGTDVKTNFLKRYEKNKKDNLAYLKSQRDVMKRVLDEGEIPYEELTEHIEKIVSYSL